MEYIYGALLLHKLGKEVTEDSLHKVISATGTAVDDGKIKTLIASLKGVDIDAELKNASAMAVAPAAGAGKEEKKEEKKEEEKQSESAAGLSSLFG
ncbi:MAG: 50S ribosomal protein L12 [Nanoarchaeota archaeon]|nr:50S ribosomal protein L12 [Nanoarchaeota archaeon]